MIKRKEVYKAIDAEREYQDEHWGDNRLPLPPSDELRLIRIYLQKADEGWHTTPDDQSSGVKVNKADLIAMRKIAAIAVRCMENFGVVTEDRA